MSLMLQWSCECLVGANCNLLPCPSFWNTFANTGDNDEPSRVNDKECYGRKDDSSADNVGANGDDEIQADGILNTVKIDKMTELLAIGREFDAGGATFGSF